MSGDIRDQAAIQAEFDQVCALLGDADVKIAQLQANKDALLVRARELGQEMHLARKVEAQAAKAQECQHPSNRRGVRGPGHQEFCKLCGMLVNPGETAAPELPRDPLVAPGSSAREVVAARKDDLKRAAERLAGALPTEPAEEPKPETVQ